MKQKNYMINCCENCSVCSEMDADNNYPVSISALNTRNTASRITR